MSRLSRLNLFGALCAVAVSAPALSQEPAHQEEMMTAERTSKPGLVAGASAEHVSATVVAVDVNNRSVTLKDSRGRVDTLYVGPDVKNLEQVKAGDRVVVWFTRGFALQLQQPGAAPVPPSASAVATTAAPGQKPSAQAEATVTGTVTIKAIDMKSRIVTLESEGGALFRVKAGKGVQIDKVKPGDKLVATYSESIAVKVTPAHKK